MTLLSIPRREDGFSLIELLVVIGLFGLIIGIATNTFSLLLRHSSQQAKTAETQIEGIIGLEILRTDIEHAGQGLPWSFPKRDANDAAVSVNYNEAAATKYVSALSTVASSYNDGPAGVPRALVKGTGAGLNGSDILVLKGVNLGRSEASQRWSYILTEDAPKPKAWGNEDLKDGERVIVMRPNVGSTNPRQLVMVAPNTFYTTYSANSFPSDFTPTGPQEHFLIYGVDPDTNPRMPFNRADYFISNTNVPRLCAQKTGVLEKVVISQADGSLTNRLPLLDCVADMKIAFRLVNETGGLENVTSALVHPTKLTPLTSSEMWLVHEVTVFILTHEGQADRNYTYPGSIVTYKHGGTTIATFDLAGTVGGNWQNYRWKVYRLTVKPKNLG